ncbi:MAG: AAA family ATPase [Planctomycetaceae bacterium]|jgi:predicted AAA+ superfamily ATPase|nr:AAA family ATPase [Planctomycetaceae bacterium]
MNYLISVQKKNLTKNDFWRLIIRVAKLSKKPQPKDINPRNELSQNLLQELDSMNPWWKGNKSKEIYEGKRQIYNELFNSFFNGNYPIVTLRGPRQVGKTTIQQQIIRDLLEQKNSVSPKQIIRIQFDDLKSLELEDPIVTIIDWFEKNVAGDTFNNLAHKGQKVYIFLDEIQDVAKWSAQLKHIVDHKSCHVFITGSSAIRIFEGKENLAGRAQWNEINTLGLSEICQFHNMGTLNTYKTEFNLDVSCFCDKTFWIDFKNWSIDEQLLDEVYKIFCELGGYPFCHTNNITEQQVNDYLSETLIARTIDQDIKASFDAEYKNKMRSLSEDLIKKTFNTFCKYTGQTIGFNKLQQEFNSNLCGILNEKQISLILDFVENSMLIKIIKPFEHHLKLARNERKICLCDHAIRKARLNEPVDLYGKSVTSDIAGHIIKGIVGTFLVSIKNIGVSYLPNINNKRDEIDFILEIGDTHIPIEVKYREHPDVNNGIESFLAKSSNNTSFGLVITKDEVPLGYFGNDNIIPISVKKLLLLK